MSNYQQRAKKRFGQHFLHDQSVIERMLKVLMLKADDTVVEIGPGPGALTFPLLKILSHLHVVEIDRDVIAWWQQQEAVKDRLTIHPHDALKLDLSQLQNTDAESRQALRIVGNLPYNISTPLIFNLLAQAEYVDDMLFMLQKEVVDRMTAEPGSKDYGRLSVMVQYFCQTDYVLKIGPGAFSPPPKVDSAVVYLKPRPYPEQAEDDEQLSALVAKAFSQRRKTLRNTLKDLLTVEQIEAAGVSPTQRAETLSVNDFVRLSRQLSA